MHDSSREERISQKKELWKIERLKEVAEGVYLGTKSGGIAKKQLQSINRQSCWNGKTRVQPVWQLMPT